MRSIVFSVDITDSKDNIDHSIVGELIANYTLVSAWTSRGRGTAGDMGIRSGIWWLRVGMGIGTRWRVGTGMGI